MSDDFSGVNKAGPGSTNRTSAPPTSNDKSTFQFNDADKEVSKTEADLSEEGLPGYFSTGPISPWTSKLVENMQRRRTHPVLIFGARGSGKTMMLQSLLNYYLDYDDGQCEIFLGDSIFPAGYPEKEELDDLGIRFYQDGVDSFRRGRLPNKTVAPCPFFVPIDFVSSKVGRIVSFVFVEGLETGDWFEHRDSEFGSGSLKAFSSEVANLLTHYSSPMSIILIAPTTLSDISSDDYLVKSDMYLAGLIDEYRRLRPWRRLDNLLLLVSKWDFLYDPFLVAGEFASPSSETVVRELVKWPYTWRKFASLPCLSEGRKALMPYSAALTAAESVIDNSTQLKPILSRFNRTLWNWLYGNATMSGNSAERQRREVLYEDVAYRPNYSGLRKLTRLIFGMKI